VFESIQNGLSIFGESVRILFKYPKFAVPLLVTWCILAPLTIYLRFMFPWENYPPLFLILIIFGTIYLCSFLFSLSCVILLELIRQHETGGDLRLGKALIETIQKDLPGILVIAFVWAIVWFILSVLKVLTSRKRGGYRHVPSPQEAATVLAGGGGVFSWLNLGISFFQKLVRMTVFLVLPAIAWEHKGPFNAIRRGLHVLREDAGEFLTVYAGTGVAEAIIYLPAIIAVKFIGQAPDIFWYGVIIYTACAWTFSMYLEQMSVALLFLWHKKWEVSMQDAEKNGKSLPQLGEVPMPSLLSDTTDLMANPEEH